MKKLLLFRLLGFLQAGVCSGRKFVLEFLDPAGCVDELQLAGIERMASAANVDLQFRPNASSLK